MSGGEGLSSPAAAEDARHRVVAYLEAGEELRWAAPAATGPHVLRALPAALVGVFLLLGLGLGLRWIFSTSGSGSKEDVLWAASPFALIASWFALSPLLAYLRSRKLIYAVTDRRAILLEGFPRNRLRAFSPSELEEIEVSPNPELVQHSAPTGHVFFKYLVSGSANRFGRHSTERVGFLGIADYLGVAEELKKLRAKAPPIEPSARGKG